MIAPKKQSIFGAEWWWWIAIVGLVPVLWCAAYNRWTQEAWQTPLSYLGDAIAEMTWAKILATGEMLPILTKYPASLGAPFVANWNDYPTMEEGIFIWWAPFVRAFGLFPGSNLVVLSAHLLAAGSFYFVCRNLRYHKAWSFVGALLFSMSYFAFARGLSHLVLTFYWHVPLGLLVAWWCISESVAVGSKKFWFGVTVAVLHGVQNPYYSALFVQFLGLAALVRLVRGDRWRQIIFPLCLVGTVILTLILMNADMIYSRLVTESNNVTLVRNYAGVELYALKPIDLILPDAHRSRTFEEWVDYAYRSRSMLLGESHSTYLGIVGVAALGYLIWVSFCALVRRKVREVPLHFAGIGWILAFSVVGGLNGIMGLFGFFLFRATNRYSIVIFALVLLFLVRELTRFTRTWHWPAIAAFASVILGVGLWDQLPPSPTGTEIQRVRRLVTSDARIVSLMESKLPPGAMIFQLPVCDYPEVPRVREMLDYEHFRPYLHSRSLRFSYGSQKGRTRERWQKEAMLFGTSNFVRTLERYGFSAVLINKKAYDGAAALLSELRTAGRSEIIAESADLVCVLLQPVPNPGLPPEFDRSWFGLEGTEREHWRWSKGHAKLILFNPASDSKTVRLTFGLGTVQPRTVDIYVKSEKVYSTVIDPLRPPSPVEIVLSLSPGQNELGFRTDRPGAFPDRVDQRKLAFNIRNFELRE